MKLTIREAVPADAPELAALEVASPETGALAVRLTPRIDGFHFTLAARYPGSRGYVALADGSSAIVGMLFASVAPTQMNGELVPGAYLFSLRVHPGYRRRGIASALVAYAVERARAEAKIEVAWAAVVADNTPSLGTFRRAGFDQGRELKVRVALPGLSPGRVPTDLTYRPATPEDLPDLAAALNAHHAGHQLWRPLTGGRLAQELAALRHPPADVALGVGPDGQLVCAASALAIGRLAHLRFLGPRLLPPALNAVLAPLFRLVPIRPLLVRRALLPADRPEAVHELLRALHRMHRPEALGLAITLDPLDPAWPVIAHLPGLTVRVHLLVKSDRPVEVVRPWHFD